MTANPDHTESTGLPIAAAAIYALSAFAAGFACGIVRVLLVAPALGAVVAVLIELPLMLVASGLLAAWSIRRCRVEAIFADRAAMGLGAFVLLMLLEFLFAVAALGQSPQDYLHGLASPAGRIGLGAQLAFAAMPLLHLWLFETPPQTGDG